MPVTLTIRDETTAGQRLSELTLDGLSERITVRELIRSRVYQEVKDINVRAALLPNRPAFHALVQPSDAERELNGYRLKKPREIDWKKQFDVAVQAFEHKSFLILIDDKQATGLDEEFDIGPCSQVSFVKLVPLVGG